MDDVAPMMATFSLAEKSPNPRGMLPPTSTTIATSRSNANGSPRSNLGKSPRMLVTPSTAAAAATSSNSNGPSAPVVEHNYGTRSKAFINAFQLEESVRMMRTFIQDVHPEGFTPDQRSMWAVIERRTLEWAEAQKREAASTSSVPATGVASPSVVGNGDVSMGRPRPKTSNGF
ncbi:hypothetical protein M408DRAFT_28450 [Serendipita vermifera MAFF 305830]|uniref:Uncharacterized protein n=1 Tax=Serendipita vermifera MAFF 305830 TaxID=933852 RepID=A0A0C3ARX7_SERVB|nr:hypothetical protein M408DRAFT_28450 [Serendipita vermifera MAFF 305830]